MKRLTLLIFAIAGMGFATSSHAEALITPTWRARLGVGVNPVVSFNDRLPSAHTGFGASLSGFIQLPVRFSAGLGFDWERYTFDSNNRGDGNMSPARYRNEVLTHSRLMALLQWDILPRHFITPYLLVGAGYGWQGATLTRWQCHPKQSRGPVLGGGVGLDVSLIQAVSVGLEYRANALPMGARFCTLAAFPDEPRGAPSDFFSQRIGLTLSVQN